MNVKTLKRFSKRSVSMLLSVLMVVSLFTVLSVTTASARDLASSTITVTLSGAAADWEKVYFVVGQENSGGDNPYVKFIEMSKVANTDSTYSASDVSFTNYDRAFFAGTKSFVKGDNTYTASGTSPNFSINGHKIDSVIIKGISGVYRTEDMDNIEWKAGNTGGGVSTSGGVTTITFGEMSSKEYAFSFKSTDVITAVRTSSTKDWENVYLVVGNGSSTKVVQMSPTTTPSTVSTPLTTSEKDISFSLATSYFFTDVLPDGVTLTNGVGTVSSSIDTVYKNVPKRTITSNAGTPQEVTSYVDRKTVKYNTKPTETVELRVSMPDYINATLYNYRSGSKDNDDGSGGQIPTTAKTTALENYAQDTIHDDSTNNEKNYRPFYKYNKAVQAWYSSKDTSDNYTPLYAGNFKNIDGGYASTIGTTMGLTHFIGLANWAENNANSVAVGLVDDKMHNGTVTQNGVEIPQFSDAFMKDNPTLQSKYPNLLFEVNKEEDAHGNEWYSYDATKDGNRYLDYDVSTSTENNVLTKGEALKGGQFFPFNKDGTADGDLIKCFGVKFEVKFSMPAGGVSNTVPLQFNFSGDDDLWVYIDDYLILDMSGAHARVDGSIDLSHSINATTGKPEGSIKGIIRSDSYKNTTWEHMTADPKENNYDLQYSNTTWGLSAGDTTGWVTPTTVDGKKVGRTFEFDSNTEAFKQITKTTEEHTMTIFYMERGLYDSNLSFNFMLPQNNTLKLTQDVDNTRVNQGLKQATMDVANKDVFNTQIKSQAMDETTTNIVEYPVEKDFTRLSPSQSSSDTAAILQKSTNAESDTNGNPDSSSGGYKEITAVYSWKDESKLIDVDGNYTTTNAATNVGAGIPDSGYVPLLYGQSATFYDQFLTYSANLEVNPIVNFTENASIYRFVKNGSYDATTGLYPVEALDGQNGRPNRNKGIYYENSFKVVDGKGALIKTGIAGEEFPYWNADRTTNKVDISINYNHIIQVGGISVKKEIDDSITSETTPNLTKEYKFKVEYVELFGDLDNTYMVKDAVSGKDKVNENAVWTTMQRVKYTLTKKNGTTEPDQTIPYEGTNAGIFKLKEGETATITGIPVGTVVRVSEVIEDDAEYEVKDITDGSGNELTNSTTKLVEKPMFVTQGIQNNVTYSYIIKNGLAMQAASLVVNTKVTTTGVNSGIATELEKIFNNDVFGYKVQTNSKKVSTNSAKLPITSAFTRTKGDGTTSDTLQTANTGSGTKGNTGSTTSTLTGMDAYYKWTDTSVRATGSGVGVPADDTYNVHLQYDQTATFDSQIALDKDTAAGGQSSVYVNVKQAPNTYTNGSNSATTGMRTANIDSSRAVADLYTTTYAITGAESTNESTNGIAAYPKVVNDLSANENVVIEYTFTNAVKLGQIKVSKTVTDGSDATTNPNGSYEFTLTYTKLFGKTVTETPAAGWEGTSSTGDKIITDSNGKFSIKKGETVTFAGVPVQTDYKVTEVIPTGAKYTVNGATLTDKNSTDISSSHLTRSSNTCTVTGSLVNVDDISKLTVDNTYSTVPVLYRYHNRVNTNGVPTSLQNDDSRKGELEWTYFVKYVDGAVSTFINSGDIITSDAKTAAISAFGTVAIDNVLATYSLTSSSTYTLKELSTDELAGNIADDTAASVGYKASVQALNANGNFYDGNKVILATIDNATRTYPVKVAYFKADEYNSTTKVNPMAEASTGVPDEATRYSADVPYNTVVPLNATITRLMLDDPTPTSNDSNGNYLFAYWEREVSYQSGNTVTTKWVPVSTNYQYSYKVVNPTNIRAVYRSTDGHNKKAYADYDTKKLVIGADNSFNALEGGTTTIPKYEKVPKPHYTIFWEMAEGTTVKKYQNSSGGFTISESTATAALEAAVAQSSAQPLIDAGLRYTVETEYKAEYVIPAGQEICLPANGYDAAATDKVVNPYVKQVGSTAQNRAVFDIVFGSAGSADSDTAITNVGYILFYGEGSNNYIDPTDEKVSETNLKAIANAAATGTANLTDATKYPGSGKCRVAKYIADKDGRLEANEIKLTNKNRVDLIIDVINDATSRNKFYTCYTYMIRGGQTYISDTPITFSPSEITLGSGGVTPTVETAYNLEIENYYQDNNNATPDDTIGANKYTKANTYGYALSNAYTFADGKNLTFTIRPLQPAGKIYKGKLVKLMAGSNEITPITSVENGGQISYTFNKDHIPKGTADSNNKTLRLKAYFDPTLVGAEFTLNATEGIEYNVYFNGVKQEDYTVTTKNKDIAVPFGTTVRVEAHTVLVNGKEGYAITDATKGNFDLADDSTRTKSQMAVKEVTVTDSMTSEALQTAIGTQPTANKLVYNVTVRKARGTYGVNITYYNQNAEEYTDTTNVMNNGSAPNITTIQVWQGNPVITYADASGTSYKEATTNATLDYTNSQITITDDNAVITVGGYAPMTINNLPANTTVYVTIGDSPETEVDLYTRTKLVPYNYDEATGTDVTIRVEADYGYLINNQYEYTKDDSMNAHKTVTFHADTSVLSSPDFVTNLPTVVQGFALTLKADTGGHITIISGARANGASLVDTVIAAGAEQTYEVAAGTIFRIEATPDDATAYAFDKWLPSNNTANPKTFNISETTTYEASFVELYSFNLTANPHSTLTVTDHNGDEVASLDGGTMGQTTILPVRSDLSEAERTFTCTMSAEDGYVPYWNNDPTDDQAVSKTVVVSDNTASISTSADELYTLTVNTTTGGTVTTSVTGTNASTVTTSGNTYTVRASKASGVTFTLTPTPADSTYSFSNWSGDYSGNANPYPLPTLDGDKTITANFSQGILVTLDTSINVYSNGTENWGSANAKIFVYADNPTTNTSKWFEMTQAGTNLYSALVENGYTKIVFVRKSSSGTAGNWNDVWQQTPSDSDRYTISSTAKDWIIVEQGKAILKKTHTITLSGTTNIASNTERWAIIYKNATTDWTWVSMTASGSNYVADIPQGYDKFVICRMNGSNSTNNFDNRWNYSYDLSINYVTYATSGGTTVNITGWTGDNTHFNVTQS